MDTQMKLLASARETGMRREADARRLVSRWSNRCRRWVLGIIPVAQPCRPTAC
jgi:hypothetical protein